MKSALFFVAAMTATFLLGVGRAQARATTTVLYRFKGGSDGRNPVGPLVFDRAGDL